MRYLTIQRNSSFVGCFTRLKIYIEDPYNGEIRIHGAPCRKIGTIKNGERLNFTIGNEKLRIYIIAGDLSKNYCFDSYEIPSGTNNIFISGSCKCNPLNGNAFRFDGIPTAEMRYYRKNATKKGVLFLIVPIIVCFALIFSAAFLPYIANPVGKSFTQEYTNKQDSTEENNTASGVLPIVKFSEKYNVSPTVISGINEIYNGTVSINSVIEYANYLSTRGYRRNTELENSSKSLYEYTYVFEGDNDYQSIIFTYNDNVFTLSYMSGCVFESVDSGNSSYNGNTISPSVPSNNYSGGTFQQNCPICYGRGEVLCNSCDGLGYYESTEYAPDYGGGSSSYQVKHTCQRCNGSGYAMCTHCSGTGKIG